MRKWIPILVLLYSPMLLAEIIEFPEEELAQESVLPIFDRVEVVKSRNVDVDSRFEVGAGIGFNLTEALYDNKSLNLNITYNFSNLHAVNFIYISPFTGLSNMGEDLANGKGLSGGRFDASLAPYPKGYMLLNYQLTAYYGKISLSKDYVMNILLYGMAGLANVTFSDTTAMGATVGMGQKFFLTKNLGLRFDLIGIAFSGPDPTSATNLNPTLITSQVPSSSLEDTLYFRTFFNLGLEYLF
ncbi:MAG: outer membrane beta-barrel domain-containing protein [Bdellovibrionaceae bacterium]|nr:outer membrane beta-barrel domain-containing protein [Pseudobdellovibrionaceae bacterium]